MCCTSFLLISELEQKSFSKLDTYLEWFHNVGALAPMLLIIFGKFHAPMNSKTQLQPYLEMCPLFYVFKKEILHNAYILVSFLL